MTTESFDKYVLNVVNMLTDNKSDNLWVKKVNEAVDILKGELKREYKAGNNVRHGAEMVEDYIESELA
jgi:hypothetical protein